MLSIDCDSSRDPYAANQPPKTPTTMQSSSSAHLSSPMNLLLFSILPFSPSQVHSLFGCPPSSIHAEHSHSTFSILLRHFYTREN